jgi:very-short-patch-repair endonuclease
LHNSPLALIIASSDHPDRIPMPEEDRKGWIVHRPDPETNRLIRPRARRLRNNTTPAERRLWQALRNRQRLGFKFRRQHVIDRFIVDFYCAEACLVIELDGEVHRFTGEYDLERQQVLESIGLRVMRFSNDQVMQYADEVVAQIDEALKSP